MTTRKAKARQRRAGAKRGQSLLGFVLFEELAGFFEVEGVAVDDELVDAGVFRDGDDTVDAVPVLAESLNDEVDVYHG